MIPPDTEDNYPAPVPTSTCNSDVFDERIYIKASARGEQVCTSALINTLNDLTIYAHNQLVFSSRLYANVVNKISQLQFIDLTIPTP